MSTGSPVTWPSAPLPAKADAPALLDRLAVRPDDAAEIMDGWPDPGSPLWTPELRWLLDRSIALVRADLGGGGWLVPGRNCRASGARLAASLCLRLPRAGRRRQGYHRDHDVPDAVSWTTLADLGRNLAVDRRMNREGWPVMRSWLTLHARGAV